MARVTEEEFTKMAVSKKKPSKKIRSVIVHPPEARAKALSEWTRLRAEGLSAQEAAAKAGVHLSLLYYWKAAAEGRARPGSGKRTVPATNGHAEPRTKQRASAPRLPALEATLEQEIRELKADVAHWKKIANAALDRKR